MENSLERTEKLLALLLLQGMKDQQQKVKSLNLAGFSNVEIADLLQTSSGMVAQALYMSKKGK